MLKNAWRQHGRTYVKIALSVGVCLAASKATNNFLQYMASCFSVVMCTTEDVKTSLDGGIKRMIVTILGGALGLVIVLVDEWLQVEWLFYALVIAGTLPVLTLCSLTKVGEPKTKSGCVCYLAVLLIKSGSARIEFAALRMLGTVFGVAVLLAVSWLVDHIARLRSVKKTVAADG